MTAQAMHELLKSHVKLAESTVGKNFKIWKAQQKLPEKMGAPSYYSDEMKQKLLDRSAVLSAGSDCTTSGNLRQRVSAAQRDTASENGHTSSIREGCKRTLARLAKELFECERKGDQKTARRLRCIRDWVNPVALAAGFGALLKMHNYAAENMYISIVEVPDSRA